MRHKNQKNKGFTLTELAIVMGIIGTITGAIWWAAGNARESQKENSAINELQTVVQNLNGLMTGQAFATSSNLTYTLITSQVIPTTYVNTADNTKADHAWKAQAFIVTGFPTGTNNRVFRITFNQVTRQGCLALLLQGTACQAGQATCPIDAFTAANSASAVTPNITTGWQTVMTTTQANTLCGNNNYSGGTNSVEFDYSL